MIFLTFHILGIISPTDELIFFRGVETTNQFTFGLYRCDKILILVLVYIYWQKVFRDDLHVQYRLRILFHVYVYNVMPPFDSVQLVHITPITMVYGTYNHS